MWSKRSIRILGIVIAIGAIALFGSLLGSKRVKAGEDEDENNESRIQRGLEIAPVPLNLAGKNRALVGLGSYIVNAVADCNGCHSQGPATEFAPSMNPYFG